MCKCQSCEEILGNYPEKQLSLTLKFCTVFFRSYNFPFEEKDSDTVEVQSVHCGGEDDLRALSERLKLRERYKLRGNRHSTCRKWFGMIPVSAFLVVDKKGTVD